MPADFLARWRGFATERHVGRSESLDLYMAPGGGFAIELRRS